MFYFVDADSNKTSYFIAIAGGLIDATTTT